jgi:hypothetical protein
MINNELIPIASVVELPHVEDTWENKDGSIGVLFNKVTAPFFLAAKYPELYEKRTGESEKDGDYLLYVGVIDLWEGEGHCYIRIKDLK